MNKPLLTLLIIIHSIFYSSWASAQNTNTMFEAKDAYLTIGSLTEFYQKVQVSESGEKNTFEFNPLIGAGVHFNTQYNFEFQTEFLWVLPRTVEHSVITENIFAFRIDFTHDRLKFFQDQLIFRVGSSLMIDIIQGKGGEVQLNNGGQTSTFYLPEQNRVMMNNTFDLALELKINAEYAIKSTAIIYQLFESERRSISYTIQLSYYFPQDNKG